jgi:hypothetical protein
MTLCHINFVLYQAIGKYLPNVIRIRCWNHTINAVKTWLRKHGATSGEIPAYTSYVRDLLNQNSCASYESALEDNCLVWSKAFLDYYMSEIHPQVMISIHLIFIIH